MYRLNPQLYIVLSFSQSLYLVLQALYYILFHKKVKNFFVKTIDNLRKRYYDDFVIKDYIVNNALGCTSLSIWE